MTTETIPTPRISESDTRTVILETNFGDRFALSSAEVVQACKLYDREKTVPPVNWEELRETLAKRLRRESRYLMAKVEEWIAKSGTRIKKISLHRDALSLTMIVTTPAGAPYDPDLEDRLSEFDADIANDPEITAFRLDVMLLPAPANQVDEN